MSDNETKQIFAEIQDLYGKKGEGFQENVKEYFAKKFFDGDIKNLSQDDQKKITEDLDKAVIQLQKEFSEAQKISERSVGKKVLFGAAKVVASPVTIPVKIVKAIGRFFMSLTPLRRYLTPSGKKQLDSLVKHSKTAVIQKEPEEERQAEAPLQVRGNPPPLPPRSPEMNRRLLQSIDELKAKIGRGESTPDDQKRLAKLEEVAAREVEHENQPSPKANQNEQLKQAEVQGKKSPAPPPIPDWYKDRLKGKSEGSQQLDSGAPQAPPMVPPQAPPQAPPIGQPQLPNSGPTSSSKNEPQKYASKFAKKFEGEPNRGGLLGQIQAGKKLKKVSQSQQDISRTKPKSSNTSPMDALRKRLAERRGDVEPKKTKAQKLEEEREQKEKDDWEKGLD